ncbi:MAG: hypothetical protein WD076_02425 [Parvularculaceae bacterium]
MIELLAGFERNRVRYLIIGGYAVGFHSAPRYTKDCDIWVAPDRRNAIAVHKTLVEFGAALQGVTAADFEERDAFFMFGAPPNKIDILLSPPGGDFKSAWRRRVTETVSGVKVHYVGRMELIALKKASGRATDKRDVEALKASDPSMTKLRKKRRTTKKRAARAKTVRRKRKT